MMRGSRIQSRNLTRQFYAVKFISLGEFNRFYVVHISSLSFGFLSPLILFILSPSPFLFLLIPPSLLLFPPIDRLSSPRLLLPAGPPLPPLLGGSWHLWIRPICSPVVAAWIPLPSLAAVVLISLRLQIYGHSFSHGRGSPFSVFMSKPCLGSSLSISPDSGVGSPSSAIFLLHVVDGVGGGRLQGIPWHGLPLIRAFIKERLALSVISSCQCCYPSASWDDNQADTSSLCLDRKERVLG